MSSMEDKNPKKSKRSFMSKLPSFRRKKSNPSPDRSNSTPVKTPAAKSKKQKNENSSNTNSKTAIAKETQTPAKYQDRSASQVVETFNKCLSALKEENGNKKPTSRQTFTNINSTAPYNTTYTTTTTTTSFVNPEYEGEEWHQPHNQNATKGGDARGAPDREINANIEREELLDSPSRVPPLSPVKTSCYQYIDRPTSVTSTLSDCSSLSLSSPGSLTRLNGGPKPYRSVFTNEPRGVKRQGSTPSDLDLGSSCVSVSGSVSSLSPTIDDVALKVTVRSGSVPRLAQYPLVAPIESLSPGVSPKHSNGGAKLEGAYTYDSSGWESEDSSKEKTLTRGCYDLNSAAQQFATPADKTPSPSSIVNLNFDLQAAAAASPKNNANTRREKKQGPLASSSSSSVGRSQHVTGEKPSQSQTPLTAQQEGLGSARLAREEALISPRSAGSTSHHSAALTNNNPPSDSSHEASPHRRTTAHTDSRSPAPARSEPRVTSTPVSSVLTQATRSLPRSKPRDQTAGVDNPADKSDEVVLTRVKAVTSPSPIKTPRSFFPLTHLQRSAMRNKLRSESFDSSDLDSLASDDLMCEGGDSTFADPSDESVLVPGGANMPGEQGFSPYPNSAKGKRLRNNSIEFLVASFDKRHRHHSTGGTPRGGNVRPNTPGQGAHQGSGRDTILVDAGTYRQMVQDLNSMKTALVRLSKMLQDPKTLTEMLAVTQQGRAPDAGATEKVAQCEQVQTREGHTQTDIKALMPMREVGVQSDHSLLQDERRAEGEIQGDADFNGYKENHDCSTTGGKQVDLEVNTERSEVITSRRTCLSISSSSSGEGVEGCLREPWGRSSSLDQGALSPLGNNQSSGDTSDESNPPTEKKKHTKGHRKHVRISDPGSDGSGSGQVHIPGHQRDDTVKVSSSDEGSDGNSRMVMPSGSRMPTKVKSCLSRSSKERSSSEDSGRLAYRQRNQSDSSNSGSDESGFVGDKSKTSQVRRPASRMQRPRQIQRPRTSQLPGRKADGSSVPASRLQKPTSHHKDGGKPVGQEQHTSLEWQQQQLQQKQDRVQKQQQVAHRQQQENQQRLHNQQQQLQKDQQVQLSANLQKQQEILLQQQQQQLRRQQQLQQHHQWQYQQQRSQELALPKVGRLQGVLMKPSTKSNQDLTSTQRIPTEVAQTTQELRHSSPDLVDSRGSSGVIRRPPAVHAQERPNGRDNPKQSSKSRLQTPSSISRLPTGRQTINGGPARELSSLAQAQSIANGIPLSRTAVSSPKSIRRTIPTSGVSKLQRQSPPSERRATGPASATNGSSRQLQYNQNNNPSSHHQHHQTTTLTTTTTVTTVSIPHVTTAGQGSRLPSPAKSNMKVQSRLAQPKVKVQSRIPKGSGIPMKSRDVN